MTCQATYMVYKGKPVVAWNWSGGDFNEMLAAARRIPGSRFVKSEKFWRAPATVDTCYALRREYGETLEILKPLRKWFASAKAEQSEQVVAGAATDAELRVLPSVAPALAATLRPDQRAGVAWLASGYRNSGLVADKPGLGKTLEAIGGIMEAEIQGRILVVCPKISVFNVWYYELKRWTDEAVYMARGTRAQRQKSLDAFEADPSERKWLIIVAEMLRVERRELELGEIKSHAKNRNRVEGFSFPELFAKDWSTIIVDESHRLLGSLTIAKSNLAGEGLAKLPLAPWGRKYAMSGTPFGKGGRIQGMFGTLHWLWPDEYTSFWKWADRHFVIEEKVINNRGKTARKVSGLRDGVSGEEFLASLGPRILRRTKEEVLPNLPPKQYAEVQCEMSGAQLKQYKQLSDDAEIVLKNGILTADGVLAEITRARQVANGCIDVHNEQVVFTGESCKVDALMEKLDARGIIDGDGDMKVVVASRFNRFLEDAVCPALKAAGVDYHMITGSTSEKQRNLQIAQFQAAGGPRVFVINSKAAGISITLDAADEMHLLDELDNPEDNEQVEDRIHRASRDHSVTVVYYRTVGTYDLNIKDSVEGKRLEQYAVLDGRRGVEDVRRIIQFKEAA